MFKEINQIPKAIINSVTSAGPECRRASELLKKARYVYIVGSGTSYHAGIILQIGLLKRGIPSITVMAPEFSHFVSDLPEKDVTTVLISQSGESIDILNALRLAKDHGHSTISITNTENSSLWNGTDIRVLTEAGPEKSVAATKTFVAALALINAIIAGIGSGRNSPSEDLSDSIDKFLAEEMSNVLGISKTLKNRLVFLGNGVLHSIALEGALKFKETATIETEAYPVREYLHGPIQMLNSNTTVVIMHTAEEEIVEAVDILRKQTDSIVSIGFQKSDDIKLNQTNDLNTPPSFVIPLQLMANYKSVSLGYNPDKPSHLSKVVK
jgi:glucosamine--fructose-6-phosphate aminotransferase (isomerizing)